MPERRLSFLLISTLLTLALGTWIISTALSRTVGEPEQTKQILNNSGIYQAVIPQQVADTQEANPSLAGVPLDNPEVQKVLANSLDSKKLEAEGGKAIEAIYAWLEGRSDKPQIDISVKANQQELAEAAGNYAFNYAFALPACAPGEADYAAFAANPLDATCLPAGITPEAVRAGVAEKIATNPALGSSTQLTEEDVKLPNGKTIMESFDSAPVWYQRAELLPMISALIIAVCIFLLLFILRPIGALRSTGKHLLSVGITMGLVAVVLAWAVEKGFDYFIPKADNPNVGDALMRLTTLFNNALRDNLVVLSLYMAAAGLAIYLPALAIRKLRRPSKAAVAPTTSTEPVSLAKTPTIAKFIPAAKPAAAGKPKAPAKKKTAARKLTAKKKPATHKKKK